MSEVSNAGPGSGGIKWTNKRRTPKVTFKKKKRPVLEDEGEEVKRLLGSYKNVWRKSQKYFSSRLTAN